MMRGVPVEGEEETEERKRCRRLTFRTRTHGPHPGHFVTCDIPSDSGETSEREIKTNSITRGNESVNTVKDNDEDDMRLALYTTMSLSAAIHRTTTRDNKHQSSRKQPFHALTPDTHRCGCPQPP